MQKFIQQVDDVRYRINLGAVPNMRVEGMFYVNDALRELVFDELEKSGSMSGHGGFLPAVQQIANVATLPGIVGKSLGMPDLHSGYGFSIGGVGAFDMEDPTAIVSPGGVGFDINCFAEDHQILTSRGFLSLDEFVSAWERRAEEPLLVASYDGATKRLIYETPAGGPIVNAARAQEMVLLEQRADAVLPCAGETSDDRCRVSLLATPNHDLYVAPSGQEHRKMAAEEVAAASAGSMFEILSAAEGGAQEGAAAGIKAFLAASSAPAEEAGSYLELCGVALGCSQPIKDLGWAWHLGREHARRVLDGVLRAASQAGAVVVASAEVRDVIVRLAMHAGFSAWFVRTEAGQWRVTVARSSAVAVTAGRDVERVRYSGRTWCVTMPHGFVVVRRAFVGADGALLRVSPPTIQGNCGVRLIRTNLHLKDLLPVKEDLTQLLFDFIPVGVGSKGILPTDAKQLSDVLEMGMDWSVRQGYAWVEDKEHCEENGRMLTADPAKVSLRARKRGVPQLGTLGAGNHYTEVQVVEKIYDKSAAAKMGIEFENQVCIFVHSGSRGLGHQVATDALIAMEAAMARDHIHVNDKQLACARINSPEGQDYLAAMSAASNFAWVNRATMTFLCRQAFAKQFGCSADDLDMNVVYDVSHNIAKIEHHMVDGRPKQLLVHRKGATRAFPPHHPLIPVDYQFTGQPVLIGGTMGTASYVLTGTELGMAETWGSTCHGAGRASSRNKSRKELDYTDVLKMLADKGISIRVASPKLVMEEAPESYKDVDAVIDTCHQAGISKKCVKLRPVAVIKG